ncbi:MAG: S8 family serine peptidase [Anaerolineae bacterium]
MTKDEGRTANSRPLIFVVRRSSFVVRHAMRGQFPHVRIVAALVLLISLAALSSVGLLSDGSRSSAAPSAIVSEGVEHVGADVWHEAGFRGAGAKIGILDSGFHHYDERIQQEELPADVITRSFREFEFGSVEDASGTVMAEIVFDLAPEAQLYLLEIAFSDVGQFTQAVDWLIEQEVDIILYARNWLVGSSGDGQGPLTDKIEEASASGILWVNKAGDAAQRHWRGEWEDLDGCPQMLDPTGLGVGCLDFAPGDDWNSIPNVVTGTLVSVGLRWDDGWDQNAEINYDLFVALEGTQITESSSSVPGAFGYPVEQVDWTVSDAGRYNVAVTRPPDETGSTRVELFLGWDINLAFEYRVPAGSIMTPADAQGALVVGAAHWTDDELEEFSSRGPTTDGRTKPDLVAPDGVSTVTYWLSDEVSCDQGGSGACGTGAAAAHIAGAAALVKSAFPSLNPDEIVAFLKDRALDLGPPGADNGYGWGRLRLGSPPGQEATPTPTSTLTATRRPTTATPTSIISPTPTATPGVELEAMLYLPIILKGE